MNLMKSFLSLLLVSLLAACGGGGGSGGTPIVGPGPSPSVNDLTVVLSSPTIANNGTQTVTVTVTALDANRNAVANVPVTISANNNGVVTTSGTSTNSSGVLTATVGIGSDQTNRTIAVSATSGSITRTANLTVAPAGQVVTASDLVFVLGASSVANTGTETVTATVTAIDANRNALAGAPVTISVDNNAVVNVSGTVSDANGRVTATIGIGADRSNRVINVTVRSGTITKTLPLTVTNAAANVVASDLVLSLSAASISSSGLETVVATATALDGNRNAIAGIPVTISVDSNAVATIGSAVTDGAGRVNASIGIGSDRSLRTINVTARTGNLVRSASLAVVSGTPAAAASDLVLVLSAPTIANNGSQTITATATALDAKRNVLAGVPVAITVNANAIASGAAAVTDAAGTVRATVGIGADRTNRRITITATSGNLSQQATLDVVDANPVVPVAADLSLVLSAASLPNGGTSSLLATATAVDANRNVVAGIPITIRVDSSALAQVSSAVTNANGVVTATVGIGADRSNRLVTVTATSGALTRTASFRVIGADLSATYAPLVTVGTVSNAVEYKLVDTNGAPMGGQSIVVSAPGLPTVNGTTDFAGKFRYTYQAPATVGSLTLTATAAGDSEVITVALQAAGGGSVDPAPSLPTSASLAADPSVVSVNASGATTNQTELRALFLGANNAPIPRVRARFDLDGNATNSDGTVAWLGGAYAYSDATGVARATFTAGQRNSPTNGVTVRVCYDVSDFPTTTCPNATRTTLTVVNEALSVAIRTNEVLKDGAGGLTFIKEYVVMVVDAAGQAKADVLITPSVDLLAYYKGRWVSVGQNLWQRIPTLLTSEDYRWTGSAWERTGAIRAEGSCPNEDVNRNAVREAAAFVAGAAAPVLSARGEDLNWNNALDPRKADVAVKMVNTARTDANGIAVLQIEYGKNLAGWVDFAITATATGIGGSESRARFAGRLQPEVPADTLLSYSGILVGRSPYGTGTVCTDDQ